jgi:hypothetical protein
MSESCEEISLTIPYKAVFSVPIVLKRGGVIIPDQSGSLLFMVKPNEDDSDDDAIISKTLTLAHADGDPYHYLIEFDLDDTSHDVGNYFYGFKTHEGSDWLPTSTGMLEIKQVIVQGQTA